MGSPGLAQAKQKKACLYKRALPKVSLLSFPHIKCCLSEPYLAVAQVTRISKVSAKVHETVKDKGMRPKGEKSGQANLQRNGNKSNLDCKNPAIILETNSPGSLSVECMVSHKVYNSLSQINLTSFSLLRVPSVPSIAITSKLLRMTVC